MSSESYVESLEALEARARADLMLINYPNKKWLPERRTNDGANALLDVVVIGAGQSGTTISHMLKREKVDNILMIDENSEGREGPWSTFARMPTLRTPKEQSGPDLGVPSLTFRAYFEALHGRKEWEALTYTSAQEWHRYVNWLRKLLQLPVRHHCRCTRIEFVPAVTPATDGDHNKIDGTQAPPTTCNYYRLDVVDPRDAQKTDTLYARKVILANGIDGSGEWHVPSFIKDTLPKHLWAHTREDIDFASLAGKRIGVLGAGASAFDNASVALENNCAEVALFFRRERLPDVNVYKWMGFPGFHQHHCDLPDALRWEFMRVVLDRGQLPPTDTFKRATKHPNFKLCDSSPWNAVRATEDGKAAIVTTPKGEFEFDLLVIGTGFHTDLRLRPELGAFVDDIALWCDRYTPPGGHDNSEMRAHPYLDKDTFRFVSKSKGVVTPEFDGLFCYNFGAFVSNGVTGASITALKWGVPMVVRSVLSSLYRDDAQHHLHGLSTFALKEY